MGFADTKRYKIASAKPTLNAIKQQSKESESLLPHSGGGACRFHKNT